MRVQRGGRQRFCDGHLQIRLAVNAPGSHGVRFAHNVAELVGAYETHEGVCFEFALLALAFELKRLRRDDDEENFWKGEDSVLVGGGQRSEGHVNL